MFFSLFPILLLRCQGRKGNEAFHMDILDTLLTILRDPIWQFIGVAVAIFALLVAVKVKSWLRYVGGFVILVLICAVLFAVFAPTQWDTNPQRLYTQVTSRSVSLYDPLNEPNTNNNWDTNTSCGFKNGAYHASAIQPGVITECLAEGITLTDANFGYQVQMTTLSGDSGGLIFGALGTNASKYRFFIGTGTYYDLFVSVNNKKLIADTTGAIHTGFNQPNELTVIVLSSTIYLYINGQFVGKTNTLGNGPISGQIGVFTNKSINSHANSTPADAFFSNVKVWKL
jgi:hypothetical protein